MRFDKPIKIEKQDNKSEKWEDFANCHARVNKTGGSEYVNAGAVRSRNTLTFEIRYSRQLEDIRLNTQIYRIYYRGAYYNIIDYDDYLEKHSTIKLIGESL
jgi:SPP1 family predicted phage head-tail adaptor